MRSVLLRARAWQLFVLLLGGAIGGFVGDVFFSSAYFSLVAMLLYGASLIGWYWSLGSFLSSSVDFSTRRHSGFFHFAALYPLIYIPIFSWFFVRSEMPPFAIIAPLHLFAMFCMIYLLYFVSKSLAMVETGRAVSFSDYAGFLMLLWFYPIGIWVIQPKINKLAGKMAAGNPGMTQVDNV